MAALLASSRTQDVLKSANLLPIKNSALLILKQATLCVVTDSFSLGFFHSLKTFDSSALWVAPFCIFAVQFLQLETRKTEGREGKERVCGRLETRLSGVPT